MNEAACPWAHEQWHERALDSILAHCGFPGFRRKGAHLFEYCSNCQSTLLGVNSVMALKSEQLPFVKTEQVTLAERSPEPGSSWGNHLSSIVGEINLAELFPT